MYSICLLIDFSFLQYTLVNVHFVLFYYYETIKKKQSKIGLNMHHKLWRGCTKHYQFWLVAKRPQTTIPDAATVSVTNDIETNFFASNGKKNYFFFYHFSFFFHFFPFSFIYSVFTLIIILSNASICWEKLGSTSFMVHATLGQIVCGVLTISQS